MKKRVHITVAGRVQGVCFRMYTRDEAARLGITGWVRNQPDGTVEILAEGEESELKQLAEWCHEGPSWAVVRNVGVQYSEASGEFDAFSITY